jgi:hypothetical protein
MKLAFLLMLFFFLTVPSLGWGQSIEQVKRDIRKSKKPPKPYPDFFGIQYRPILPIDAFGAGPVDIAGERGMHNATITQNFSASIGGVVRIGITKRLAVESGINFTRRQYQTDYAVPDSGFTAQTFVRNISYDIPVNLLVYVQVNERFFINTSFGNSFLFFPSRTASQTNTFPHNYITESVPTRWVQFALNANAGMEYRTDKNGIFYLGASFQRPFTDLYQVRTTYRYINDPEGGKSSLSGNFFTLDVKYFFPLIKSKGTPVKTGVVD